MIIKKTETLTIGESLPWAEVLENLPFDQAGLLPAIAQQYNSGEVLMMAWMNRASIDKTLSTGRVCYFSRSRQKLWQKGEVSGQVQYLREMRLDCDGDAILLLVDQTGPACHTGRKSCFYNLVKNGRVTVDQERLIDPKQLYEKSIGSS